MSLTHLWAPWRMEFIKGKPPQGCVFCDLPAQKNDRENLIVYRGKECFIILNKYPYNNGHVLIVPNLHVATYTDVPDSALVEMNALAKKSMKALDASYAPQGYNIGINQGEAAGAGVKHHLHLHIVPRWSGDTNFMPVLAETKSLPQHLMKSFDDLYPLLQEQGA
jgi:ATP adenylyltransferase